MAEENPATKPETNSNEAALKQEIELLKRKNREIVEEKQQFASIEKNLSSLPEGTDVQALIEFKQKVEQERLEEKGNYSEALNKREAQFKEVIEKKDSEIESLKNELKDLKLITPAVTALSDLVHDPDYAMAKLDRDKIKVEQDGSINYLSNDGFTSKPLQEAVKEQLQPWALKNQPPVGSGAPIGTTKTSAGSISGIDANLLKRLANGEDLAAHEIHQKYGRDAWLEAKKIAKDYK